MAAGNAKINVIVDGLKQVQALERSLNNISRLTGKINQGISGAVPVKIEKTTAQLKEAQRASMIRTRNIGDQIERLSAQGLNVDKARAAIKRASIADSQKLFTLAKAHQESALNTLKTEQFITREKRRQKQFGSIRGGFGGGIRGNKFNNRSNSAALQSGLISGAFPMLFGQGLLGGAAGFAGGVIGTKMGGQMGGFAGGLVATALLSVITQAREFRKQVEKVNDVIEKTGGTSRISASEITALSKRMKVTKEEALKAASAFAAFGAQASLALAETFKDRSTFNLYANLNKDAKTFITTVDTLFQKNELGINQAKRSLKVLQTKGLKEASIYAEAIKNEQKIRKELEQTKPTEEDKRRADAVFKTYFDPQTLLPLQNFVLLNKEAREEVLKLITNEGQLEARLGTVEERFKKRLDLVKQNIEAQRDFNKSVRDALIIQAPKDELERLRDPLLQIDALGKSIGASFSESFKGIVKGSMTAQEALRNLFSKTADHFLDMAAQMLAAQIRSGIFGLFNSFGTKTISDPTFGTGIPSGDNLPKGSFGVGSGGRVGKRLASGGYVSSPTMGLIGEAGESEYVIPASKMSGAMARYSAGARGGAVIPGGSHESGTVAGGSGNTIIEYTGPTLNFNGDEYVPKTAVPEIINTAARRGGEAGQAKAFSTLKNSRSQRATLGL